MTNPMCGSIEAGGTKFVCAVGRGPDSTSEPVTIPTTDPATTLRQVIDYFRSMQTKIGRIEKFGVASFGPAVVDPKLPRWGSIMATPKPGWSNVNIRGAIAHAFDVPVGFDTDVNGAVLAEIEWGAAKGASVAAYVTVGTGIGVGLALDGKAVHGKRHPELGHVFPRRHPADLDFRGVCPFHADCQEGLAAGPAIFRRWGKPLSELPHEAHEIIAWYLGQLAVTLAAMSTEVIIFGGGVLNTPGLLNRIRSAAAVLNKGYWAEDAEIKAMIREPGLGQKAGLLGGLLLAQRASA